MWIVNSLQSSEVSWLVTSLDSLNLTVSRRLVGRVPVGRRGASHATRATVVEGVTAEVLVDAEATAVHGATWRWAAREHLSGWRELARGRSHAHRRRWRHSVHGLVGSLAALADAHRRVASLKHVTCVVITAVVVVEVPEAIDDAVAEERRRRWWRNEVASLAETSGATTFIPDSRALLGPVAASAAAVAGLRIAHTF